MNKERKTWKIICWILIGFLMVLTAIVYFNREWIKDYFRGISYQPSSEMIRIRQVLDLTDKGEFWFNAAQPVLLEKEDFNKKCRKADVEISVLGCYAEGDIFVYNITNEELDGIRELTTAHELLHTVWARMSDSEKQELSADLDEVFNDNRGFLEDELNTYEEHEHQEELYVRAGTEVKKLPDNLEKHYAEVFNNQDNVVDLYDKYISVFRKLENEMEQLSSEMEELHSIINDKISQYEERIEKLNMEITDFNECAETMGCFESENEFYSRRYVLVNEQSYLESLYQEIDGLINDYNLKVEKYNEDVLYSDKLNTMINSSVEPQGVE